MAKIKKAQDNFNFGLPKDKKAGFNFGLPKGAKAVPQKDRRPSYIQKADKSITNFSKKVSDKVSDDLKTENLKKAFKNLKNFGKDLIGMKTGASVKKKMKNGGSLSGLKASTKRDKGTDVGGAWTKVQNKTLAGAKGKASLTKDKQLGATKMTAKKGMKISKKK
jgi:hypothetical protein